MLLVAHRTPLTAAGCQLLAKAGAGVFELDVQAVRGRLVVSHFLPVLRVPGWLENDNWRVRWAGRGNRTSRDPRVADVVALVPAGCDIVLDLKGSSPLRRAELKRLIRTELTDISRYRVTGSEPADLDELRTAGFRTWRAIGRRRELDRVLAGGALLDETVSVRHTLVTASSLARLHGLVPTVVAWTVNDIATARRLMTLGVDGLTTDTVDVLEAASRR